MIRHGFILKRHLNELEEEVVYKLSLFSTLKRCETILMVPKHKVIIMYICLGCRVYLYDFDIVVLLMYCD